MSFRKAADMADGDLLEKDTSVSLCECWYAGSFDVHGGVRPCETAIKVTNTTRKASNWLYRCIVRANVLGTVTTGLRVVEPKLLKKRHRREKETTEMF